MLRDFLDRQRCGSRSRLPRGQLLTALETANERHGREPCEPAQGHLQEAPAIRCLHRFIPARSGSLGVGAPASVMVPVRAALPLPKLFCWIPHFSRIVRCRLARGVCGGGVTFLPPTCAPFAPPTRISGNG